VEAPEAYDINFIAEEGGIPDQFAFPSTERRQPRMKTAAPTMEHQVNAFLAKHGSRPEYSASTRLAYASDLRFPGLSQTSLSAHPNWAT
jgi:hypothetical protein